MGSYAPTPFITSELLKKAIDTVIEPTIEGLNAEKISYKGMLYCGLMLTENGPRVVEFNCRFGDPETQVVLPLIETDLIDLVESVCLGNLGDLKLQLSNKHAVCVIAASGGYPDSYEKGKKISGLDRLDHEVTVFHAGTQRSNGDLVTSGGRVLGVTSTGSDLKQAVEKVYSNISRIQFEGMHYRRDIAKRAL